MNMNRSSNDSNKKNFSRGLYQIDIPELGKPIRGKAKDNWILATGGSKFRVVITTDRQSVFGRNVCTIPGKGQISNLISAYWFEQTKDIVPNHMLSIPHPNILIAKQAVAVIPIEVVLRRYLAKGLTSTSVYFNYFEKRRRKIYGRMFPNDLLPNQEFPMGTILTPTTKAEDGDDKELTESNARLITDSKFGSGTWNKINVAAYAIFERARAHCLDRGLILADTKFEFGIDENREIMLIDEVLTPDGSRFWLKEKYGKSFKNKEIPEFDKDILVRWFKKGSYKEGQIPLIDMSIINKMLYAYTEPYRMITGKNLPIPTFDPSLIKGVILSYFNQFPNGFTIPDF